MAGTNREKQDEKAAGHDCDGAHATLGHGETSVQLAVARPRPTDAADDTDRGTRFGRSLHAPGHVKTNTEGTAETAKTEKNSSSAIWRALRGFFFFVPAGVTRYSYRSACVGAIRDARRAGT